MIPVLPLDVVQLIAEQVDEVLLEPDSWNFDRDSKRRQVGRNMALVCKDWKEIGLSLVWRKITIELGRSTTADLAFDLLLHIIEYKHLLQYVKEARIYPGEGKEPSALDLRIFQHILKHCTALQYLHLKSTALFAVRLLEDTTSPVYLVPHIDLWLDHELTHDGLSSVLQLLPILTNMRSFLLSFFEPAQPPTSALPTLKPQSLALEKFELIQNTRTPFRLPNNQVDYLDALLGLCEPSMLRSISLNLGGGPSLLPRYTFFSLLTSFSRLTDLELVLMVDAPHAIFPPLTTALPHLKNLRSLIVLTAILPSMAAHTPKDPSFEAHAALTALIKALPLSLRDVQLKYALEETTSLDLFDKFLRERLEAPLKSFAGSFWNVEKSQFQTQTFVKKADSEGRVKWVVDKDS